MSFTSFTLPASRGIPLADATNSRAAADSPQPHKSTSSRHRSKPHSKARFPLGIAPRKAAPTCTISLAVVSAHPTSFDESDPCSSSIPFPSASLSVPQQQIAVPFPAGPDSDSLMSDSFLSSASNLPLSMPERRRQRSNAYLPAPSPSSLAAAAAVAPSTKSRSSSAVRKRTSTGKHKKGKGRGSADVQFVQLLQRSVAWRLAERGLLNRDLSEDGLAEEEREFDGSPWMDGLEAQDNVLVQRLRAYLVAHGYKPWRPIPLSLPATHPPTPPSWAQESCPTSGSMDQPSDISSPEPSARSEALVDPCVPSAPGSDILRRSASASASPNPAVPQPSSASPPLNSLPNATSASSQLSATFSTENVESPSVPTSVPSLLSNPSPSSEPPASVLPCTPQPECIGVAATDPGAPAQVDSATEGCSAPVAPLPTLVAALILRHRERSAQRATRRASPYVRRSGLGESGKGEAGNETPVGSAEAAGQRVASPLALCVSVEADVEMDVDLGVESIGR
ncbi:hypothetical protein HGRIS_010386 [Hohenbuehelia grisea]|uniref:Uncharacterized protein n=1 Tax=Hohenbuehelia grisea TaxID=104357 RepID=A0ABR3J4K5_9AGAR